MSGAHTPGEWSAIPGNVSGMQVISADQPKVRRNVAAVGGPNRGANARLIAAAPDLLAACLLFVKYDGAEDDDGVDIMLNYVAANEAIRAAIAKAKGGAA